ncbi:hypothetical protein ACH518_20360 [Methylomonas sp. HW2-6]|uniref:hypothetical protein n=1 Tax=Methylomonas sp. HW2-6 TaxID=3376687 RepID=UPI0040416FB8
MYQFDRVAEQKINGTFEVLAINDEDNQAYLLRDVIINAPDITLEGFRLSISCNSEKYVYRVSFNTANETKEFADSVLRLLLDASKKNFAAPCA